MRAITVTVGPLASASANNICLSQTPSSAFTLNGSTGGTLDTPRRVLFTQAASESGKTYTIVGTTWGGAPQTEVLSAASSATTTYSALDFLTVTSITISSAAAGAITVGTNGVASSAWVRMDEWSPPFFSIQSVVSGTVNYTVQQTMQNPNSATNPVAPYSVTWADIGDYSLVGATGNVVSFGNVCPSWVRVTLNSGSGSVRTTLAQSTGGGGGGGGGSGGGSTKATAADPTYTEGAVGVPLSLDLSGHQRVLDSAVLAELVLILAQLQTPASSLPPPVPVTSTAALATFTNATVDITTATTTTLISATASQVGRIHKGVLVIGGAQTIQFKSASTNLSGVMVFGSGGGTISLNDDVYPELKTGTNEALTITTTTTASVAGWIQYVKGAPT